MGKPGTYKRDYFEEYFGYGINLNLSAGSGSTIENSNLRIDSDADFKFIATSYQATSDKVYLRYQDSSAGRFLMKSLTDLKAIGGTTLSGLGNGFLPFVWPRPYLISAATNLTVEAADYSGSSNTVRLLFHGAKVRPGKAPWDKPFAAAIPHTYNVRETVSADDIAALTLEIDIDAHFLVKRITGRRTGSALLNIHESSRGREWFNIPVHFDNFIGSGEFPNRLLERVPRFIRRGSVLSFNVTDLSGASNDIEICLSGIKLYE